MKKIFTLMLAIGLVTFASAQQNKQIIKNPKEQTQVVKMNNQQADYRGNQADYNSYSLSMKQKQAEINRINQEYDRKIGSIQRTPSARTAAISRKLRQLEQERDAAIRAVELRYDKSMNNAHSYSTVKNKR